MKRNIFLAATLTALGGVVLLCIAVFGVAKQNRNQVEHLKNGITVEVLPVKPNEVADMLNMRRWKFHVTLPPGKNTLLNGIEVWRTGQRPVTVLGFGGELPSGATDLSVIQKNDSFGWGDDPEVTLWLRQTGASSGAKTANPLYKGARVDSLSSNYIPEGKGDDYFVLETFYLETPGIERQNGLPTRLGNSVSLVLKLKPVSYPNAPVPTKPNFWQNLFGAFPR